MQIQRPQMDAGSRRLSFNAPTPPPQPTPPGQHHNHGLAGTLMHVGHDVAMVGMSLPAAGHCHAQMSADPHAGHHHAHGSEGSWLNTGTAVLSGAVAVGAAIHGVQMLGSKDRFSQLEGANHLLMSASCGVMAGSMLAPQSGLAPYSAPLMAAHGIGEVALGVFQLSKGIQEDCQGHKLAGAIKVAHGGCLAAAQFFPGAALPLYLGMTAVTAAQLSLQQAGLSH
jgi:hypothetical protein